MAVLDTNLKSQNENSLYGENGRLQALGVQLLNSKNPKTQKLMILLGQWSQLP